MLIYHPINGKAYKNLKIMSEGQAIAPLHHFTQKILKKAHHKVQKNQSILYGNPRGEREFLEILSKSYTKDLGFEIKPENIVFTSGITQGLRYIGNYIDDNVTENDWIFETKPNYIEFRRFSRKAKNIIDNLEDFNFASDKFSKLLVNAKNIKKIFDKHNLAPDQLKYIYLVNPTNPLGQYITPEEWQAIIPILQKHDKALIILDEAYSDVTFNEDFVSLMSVAPEDVRRRIVLFRTGSKSLSMGGIRIAVVISLNEILIDYISNEQLDNQIHVNLASQYVFTKTIEYLSNNPHEKRHCVKFYKNKIKELEDIAIKHNIKSTHMDFEQTAGIFTFIDLKKLRGLSMNKETCKYAYHSSEPKVIENDVDIYFHLLFEYNFALFNPGSCYGFPTEQCIFRLSANESESIIRFDEILIDINSKILKRKT